MNWSNTPNLSIQGPKRRDAMFVSTRVSEGNRVVVKAIR